MSDKELTDLTEEDFSGDTPSTASLFQTDMEPDARIASSGKLRYWMKAGETRKLVFLTSGLERPAIIWEHSALITGHYPDPLTCLEIRDVPCPLCTLANAAGKSKRYKMRFYTVIDTSTYIDKHGKEQSNTIRLLAARHGTVDLLERRLASLRKDGHSLRGATFDVHRDEGKTTARVGSDFELLGVIPEESLMTLVKPNDYLKDLLAENGEFKYAEILKANPDSIGIACKRLQGGGGGAAAPTTSGGATDLDALFK